MKFLQLFHCVRGHHERSRSKAWQDGDSMRSQCRGCGKPMVRHSGSWKVDAAPEK